MTSIPQRRVRPCGAAASLLMSAALSVAALVATACTPAQPGPTPARQPTPSSAPPTPAPSAPSPLPQAAPSPIARLGQAPSPAPGGPDALVARAVADAAERSGSPASEVTVASVTPREWSDRSLGCPKPGVGYAQVITSGYLIVVEARGRRFEYHTDQSMVMLCEP
jgi:hypothetical protein